MYLVGPCRPQPPRSRWQVAIEMGIQFELTSRALERDQGRGAWLIWSLTAILMAAWLAWFVWGEVTVYATSPKARVELSAASYPIVAQQSGAVVRSELALDRVVRAGEVLVALDEGIALAREAEAERQLAALPARLVALRNERAAMLQTQQHEEQAARAALQIAGARLAEGAAQLEVANDHERRLSSDQSRESISEIERVRARADVVRSTAQHEALKADEQRLVLEARGRASRAQERQQGLEGQIAVLEGLVAQANAVIQRNKVERERLRVRAPANGRLAEVVTMGAGTWVREGQHLATVLPTGTLQLVASFDAAHSLGRVKVGQRAWVRLDGFAWVEHGKLAVEVARVGSESRDGQLQVEFRLQPDAPPLRGVTLQHGLTGTVDVALETVSPARLVLRGMSWTAETTTAERQARGG